MRIRYEKTQTEGVVKSKNVLFHPNNGSKFVVYLNLNEGKWEIVDYDSDLVAASGWVKSPHKMKIEVRKKLDELGMSLSVDVRKKRKVA